MHMEKRDIVFRHFDSSSGNDNKSAVAGNKEDFLIFFHSVEKEVIYTEKEFFKINQELADTGVKINELSEIEKQLAIQIQEIETNINAFSPQEIKQTYATFCENQVKLAAAQERKVFLQKNSAEFEAKLAELYKKKEYAEKLSSQLELMTVDENQANKLSDNLTIIDSQNFGLKIIKAQEEERRRVAREIHDGPAQAMANVIFLAEVCEKLIAIDSDRAKRELHELRDQVRGCLDETRKIIFDLRPMALDDLGLVPTVKRIVDILKERMGLKIHIKISGTQPQKLDSNIEVSLFRIIQEALNNIEKHSNASEAHVLMEFQNDYVIATVKDNGNGFEVMANCNESKTFGLLGMKERVSLLNGELKINSQRGYGTEINVKIPLIPVGENKRLA